MKMLPDVEDTCREGTGNMEEEETCSSLLIPSTVSCCRDCDGSVQLSLTHAHSLPTMTESLFQRLRLPSFALGIFICYFLFGIFQEKITRTKYGESKEMFTCTFSLVLIQCVVNALFARIIMQFQSVSRDTTPQRYYIMSATTYLTAMVSSNRALQYVNYPTQVIGKSCKPIPVMILGALYARKKYPFKKYCFILTIVAGVVLFVIKDSSKVQDETSFFGYFLLIFSLAMDGLTGGLQDRMRGDHKTKFSPMMFFMNFWSTILLLAVVLVIGEIWTFIDFVQRFPAIFNDIFCFSILSALGQLFIFLTVAEFGPLPCSVVTTTRKFFTVLVSIIYFANPATTRQWIGTFLVFLGIGLDSTFGKEKKPSSK